MKGKKLLSFVLSLALVLGMGVAFTIMSCAEEPDAAVTPVTPASIYIDGQEVEKGEYYYSGSVHPDAPGPEVYTGYAYYKNNGHLELHDLQLTTDDNETDAVHDNTKYGNNDIHAAVYAIGGGDVNTLYIDLFGNSNITAHNYNYWYDDYGWYSNPYKPDGIYAKDLELIISEDSEGGSLTVLSEIDGIVGAGIEVLSGNIEVTASDEEEFSGFYSSKGDILFSGGKITVKSAYNGIFANDVVRVDGADVTVETAANDGIYAGDSVAIKSGSALVKYAGNYGVVTEVVSVYGGKLEITKAGDDGIYAEEAVDVNGGDIKITEAVDNGIYVEYGGDVTVANGKILIEKAGDNGIEGDAVTVNFGGEIEIAEADDDGLNVNTVEVNNGGKIVVTETGDDGIEADVAITVNPGGTIFVGTTGDGGYGLYGGDITVTSGSVYINKTGSYGITGDEITVEKGGKVTVKDAGSYGIDADENVSISGKSIVKVVKSAKDGIKADGTITVNDSELEAFTTSTVYTENALYPTANPIGKLVIFAGDDPESAVEIAADEDLGKYKYVHIYPGTPNVVVNPVVAGGIFAAISNAFQNLFSWTNGFNAGSMFKAFNPFSWFSGFNFGSLFKAPVWNSFFPFFKWF